MKKPRGKLPSKRPQLSVISCSGCGACCLHMVQPPFSPPVIDPPPGYESMGDPEPHWERLVAERPNVAADLKAYSQRLWKGEGPEDGTPCYWFDPETRGCRHYEYRPDICREFELGGEGCLRARRTYGIDPE